MIKYIHLPFVDDDSVDIILEIPSIHPSISNVELHVEVEPIFTELGIHESQSIGFAPLAQSPTEENATLLHHANAHHADNPFSPSSSELAIDTNVNLIGIEQLVYSKPSDIFRDVNVNNRLHEKENKEHEEQEDFEEVNLETDSTTLEVPLHEPNIPFFSNID
ncbi:hypothetical protein DITRI_Ditri02bG0129700 [Diplodiscus trichospermus]